MIVTFQGINWQTEFLIRVFVTYPSPHPTFCSKGLDQVDAPLLFSNFNQSP